MPKLSEPNCTRQQPINAPTRLITNDLYTANGGSRQRGDHSAWGGYSSRSRFNCTTHPSTAALHPPTQPHLPHGLPVAPSSHAPWRLGLSSHWPWLATLCCSCNDEGRWAEAKKQTNRLVRSNAGARRVKAEVAYRLAKP
jgi:hypothetical protein